MGAYCDVKFEFEDFAQRPFPFTDVEVRHNDESDPIGRDPTLCEPPLIAQREALCIAVKRRVSITVQFRAAADRSGHRPKPAIRAKARKVRRGLHSRRPPILYGATKPVAR